jgi:hypothetical protein
MRYNEYTHVRLRYDQHQIIKRLSAFWRKPLNVTIALLLEEPLKDAVRIMNLCQEIDNWPEQTIGSITVTNPAEAYEVNNTETQELEERIKQTMKQRMKGSQ